MNTTPLLIDSVRHRERGHIVVGIFMAWQEWDFMPSIFALGVPCKDGLPEEWHESCRRFLEYSRRATIQLLEHAHLKERHCIAHQYLLSPSSLFAQWVPGTDFCLACGLEDPPPWGTK